MPKGKKNVEPLRVAKAKTKMSGDRQGFYTGVPARLQFFEIAMSQE